MDLEFITRQALKRLSQAEQQVGRICQCLAAVQPTRSSHWWHPGFQSVLLTHLLFPALTVEAIGILARLRAWRETVRVTAASQSGLAFAGDRERILTEEEAWFVQARHDFFRADILAQLDPVETWLVQREYLHVPLPDDGDASSISRQDDECPVHDQPASAVDSEHSAVSSDAQSISPGRANVPGELLDFGAKANAMGNAMVLENEQLMARKSNPVPPNYEI